jgi:hypothetical protein
MLSHTTMNAVEADADAQKAMADYHDLVASGRREVLRVES